MRRLPRKRYKQLVKQIQKGMDASHELEDMLQKQLKTENANIMHDVGAANTFDSCMLPNTLDELLDHLD